MVSRRALLLGSGGAALAVAGAAVAGKELLGPAGSEGTVPDVAIGAVTSTTFSSEARGKRVTYAVSLPPGHQADGLPVVLALHGLGGTHRTGLTMGLPAFQAEAVAQGTPPFAVVTVDGGTGYYHPHHGDDAGSMVIEELIPRLTATGLDTSRLGFYGWSMGGYGSLRLAGLLGASRVRGVAAASPALWVDPSDASRSGFDDAAEYEKYSVMTDQSGLHGIPVRLQVGDADPFRDATRTYARGFAPGAATLTVGPGAHERSYWRRILPGELRFLGRRLDA